MISFEDWTTNPMIEKLINIITNQGYLVGDRHGSEGHPGNSNAMSVQSKKFLGGRQVDCYLTWDPNNLSMIEMRVHGRGKNNKHVESMKRLAGMISAALDVPIKVILVSNEFEQDADTLADER